MAPPDLESAAAPEGPSSSSSASQSADQPSTTRKSYFKLFTSGYWKKRRADHRPPPLKTPVNKQGQELEWQGPRHRKTAAEQAVVDAERAQHQHPELHRPKRRNLGARFFTPQQVKPRDYLYVKILGKIGWVAKALVYSIIGGQCCNSGVGDESMSISPQGAFILVGSNSIGTGLLIVMGACIALYAAWRFWEGITGQGHDAERGKALNFFRYRLSPLVSGGVYSLYAVFVLTLLPKDTTNRQDQAKNSAFPDSWAHSGIGKTGLCLAGIAFVAAFLVQLEGVLTKNFHETLKPKKEVPKWLWWPTLVTGHIGFLARAAVFMFVAIMFFRTVQHSGGSGGETAIGNALAVLKGSRTGRAGLFIIGTGLIIYGVFATLNGIWVREFPTRVPSGIPMGYVPRALAAGANKIMNTLGGGTASDNAATALNGTPDGEPETVHVQAKNGEVITAELPHSPSPTTKSAAEQKSPPEFDVEAQTPRADHADLRAQQAAGNMPLSSATQSLNRSDRSLSPRGNQH